MLRKVTINNHYNACRYTCFNKLTTVVREQSLLDTQNYTHNMPSNNINKKMFLKYYLT